MTETRATVTQWAGGQFFSVPRPDWWEQEIHQNWPPGTLNASRRLPDLQYGERNMQAIEVYKLTEDRGFMVDLDTVEISFFLWVPTEPDLLAFLIDKAGAWCALHASRSSAESLEHIRNALISIARHGVEEGAAVDPWDGRHKRDAP